MIDPAARRQHTTPPSCGCCCCTAAAAPAGFGCGGCSSGWLLLRLLPALTVWRGLAAAALPSAVRRRWPPLCARRLREQPRAARLRRHKRWVLRAAVPRRGRATGPQSRVTPAAEAVPARAARRRDSVDAERAAGRCTAGAKGKSRRPCEAQAGRGPAVGLRRKLLEQQVLSTAAGAGGKQLDDSWPWLVGMTDLHDFLVLRRGSCGFGPA